MGVTEQTVYEADAQKNSTWKEKKKQIRSLKKKYKQWFKWKCKEELPNESEKYCYVAR